MAERTRDEEQFWTSLQRDPVGTMRWMQQELAAAGYQVTDPRLDEMHAVYQQERELQAYDQMVEQIVNDPRNADINPNRLHLYVSAAEGDFNKALEMYRADTANMLTDYGLTGRQSADPYAAAQAHLNQTQHPAATPEQRLHAAVDAAVAMSRGRR
jgi:hypothetical protein